VLEGTAVTVGTGVGVLTRVGTAVAVGVWVGGNVSVGAMVIGIEVDRGTAVENCFRVTSIGSITWHAANNTPIKTKIIRHIPTPP
jgi:hypothetical protein